MNAESSGALERLTASSLEKCLAKLTKVSAGTWRIIDIKACCETPEDALRRHNFKSPAAAVYSYIKGDFPFASMMLFDPDDIECISRCFLGYYFSGAPGLTRSEELMLLELGNIILNSIVGAVSDGFNKFLTPSIPQCIQGDSRRIVKELGAIMDLKQSFRIITFILAIQCDNRVSRSEVFGLIPQKLAEDLEQKF